MILFLTLQISKNYPIFHLAPKVHNLHLKSSKKGTLGAKPIGGMSSISSFTSVITLTTEVAGVVIERS